MGQPAETLSCTGCHDRREQSPSPNYNHIAALQRAPSEIQPGRRRLQPIQLPAPRPTGTGEILRRLSRATHGPARTGHLTKGDFLKDGERWYTSYRNLKDYDYHLGRDDGWVQPRTIPGQFGARASAALPDARQGPPRPEARARGPAPPHALAGLQLRLFGSYEHIEAQAKGEIVPPTLE